MASMLTTVDNPHDPRQDFAGWMAWDMENGYNTCSYLARVALLAEDLPQAIVNAQIEQAMKEIVKLHDGGLYKLLPLDPEGTDNQQAAATLVKSE